jgi:precorrin-2 dehydrogenase / sirohydrochlorin ferrochelatase
MAERPMSEPGLFPMFLKLAGRKALVVGAGEIASAKIASLLDAGARVKVVAPRALDPVRALAREGLIEWHEREYRAEDLDGVFLVIAGTADTAVNFSVFSEAERRGILCNAVDDPPNCDFYFGAVVKRGALQVAISSAGESPALVQRLRREIDARLDARTGEWLGVVGELRREILATYPASDARKEALHELAQVQVCEAAQCPARLAAHEKAAGGSADALAGDAQRLLLPAEVRG